MVDAIVNEIERNEDVPLACDAKEFTCNCGIPVSWWGREEDPEGFLLHMKVKKECRNKAYYLYTIQGVNRTKIGGDEWCAWAR